MSPCHALILTCFKVSPAGKLASSGRSRQIRYISGYFSFTSRKGMPCHSPKSRSVKEGSQTIGTPVTSDTARAVSAARERGLL